MPAKKGAKQESGKSQEKAKPSYFEDSIEIPEGVAVSFASGVASIKGKLGEIRKDMHDPKFSIKAEGNEVKFTSKFNTKKEKTKAGTLKALLKGMFKGVSEGICYKLKICAGHFPMNVSVSGSQFTVKNFLGEKVPRVLHLKEGVKVKVEGEIITVEGLDKGTVSQTAASIETLTRRVGFDRRRFQDGIYIIDKDGK